MPYARLELMPFLIYWNGCDMSSLPGRRSFVTRAIPTRRQSEPEAQLPPSESLGQMRREHSQNSCGC